MKVLNDTVKHENADVATKILSSLERLVCRHRNLLPKGWRAIIEFQDATKETPYFVLDVQSNQGGGEMAAVKMQMMNKFDLPYSGGMEPAALKELVQSAIGRELSESDANAVLAKLDEVESLEKVPDCFWESWSDLGLTRWYGAIRVPYDILAANTAEHPLVDRSLVRFEELHGEIRISFSGAKELEDLMFAVWLLDDIQHTLISKWSKSQIWWNLRKLEKNPHISLWLELLDVKEAY